MIASLAAVLDTLGLIAFAVTGALVASRKQMDVTGFALLAIVTGVGGGTLRDLLLGNAPVGWIVEPRPVVICAAVAVATFFLAHIPRSRLTLVLRLDAVGLAVFAAGGARTALEVGAPAFAAVVMGVVTATFGGIIRDVLGGESPVILQREIYVTAALAGALVLVGLDAAGVARDSADVAGFAVALVLRGLALRRDWSLPRYRPFGPRELEPAPGDTDGSSAGKNDD